MHLEFKTIRLTRFGSFTNEALLSFDDMGPGVYYLKGLNKVNPALGSNGVGKSTIVKALRWCLEGKTGEGLKNPDILPWSGKGKTEVELTILIDKQEHIIKRTANPNLITIDGKEVGQDYVNKLIAIPFEIIPYTIILGQRRPLFFDLTASEKLKLFSEVLNLDRWETRSNHASELTNNLEKEIQHKESELSMLKITQKQALADFDSLKRQSVAWEEERADKLSNAEQSKIDLQSRIVGVSNQRDTADLKLDLALTELKPLIKTISEHYSELRTVNNNINLCETNLKHERREKEKIDAQLRALDDDNCPTCKQSIKSEKLQKQIRASLQNAFKSFINGIEINQDNFDRNVVVASHIQVTINHLEKAKEQFEKDAEEARDILDRLLPKIADWQAQIKAIEKQLEENAESNNPYTEQLQTLRRRRDQTKTQIQTSEKTIVDKTEYCERARFWIKGFKDVKLLIVEEILQELQITTSAMLETFGLVNWQIKYDIERETKSGNISRGLNITVLSPNNKNAVKWESWSGGESQRLRLIGTAALSSVLLNHVGISTNIEAYDEPTESLSKEGVHDLVELLAERAKETKKSILFVDHHSIESAKFIQTILVTKDDSGSSLKIV